MSVRLWLLVDSDQGTDRQCHLLSCPGQLKTQLSRDPQKWWRNLCMTPYTYIRCSGINSLNEESSGACSWVQQARFESSGRGRPADVFLPYLPFGPQTESSFQSSGGTYHRKRRIVEIYHPLKCTTSFCRIWVRERQPSLMCACSFALDIYPYLMC